MRALIQRVSRAEVTVDGRVVGACKAGLLIFLGVGNNDTRKEANALWAKISTLRIFADAEGKTNLSVLDVGGEICVVSQFTLYASTRKGRRPSFTESAQPDVAEELYDYFCETAEVDVAHVGRGVFGAEMQVALNNDGPFTIYLDTDDFKTPRRQS